MRLRLLIFLLVPVLGFGSEQWTEVKSDHFTVVTDAGEKKGRDVVLRFEQMRQVFGTLMLHGEVKVSRPVQILAFKNTKEMRQMAPVFKGKPVEVAGLYQKGQAEDYIAVDLSTEGDYKWHTVFHEYAHLLLNSNTIEWPAWYDEGFAELFSTIDLSGKNAVIGRAPESAAVLVTSNRLVPVAQLFAVQHDSPTYNESGDHRNMFYAESWLIVHYIQEKHMVKPVLMSFAESHGRPDEQIFRKNVGMSFSEFDHALEEYVRGNHIMGWDTPLPTGIDASSFEARTLSANDALVAVAEMHANEKDHSAESIGELQQALAADPSNIKAQSDLGYAYLNRRDFEHAEPYLEKSAAAGSKDAMVHCYYAQLLQQKFQSSVNPTSELLDRQRKELDQAIALNPNLAEAYNLLAINAQARGDANAAVQAGLKAVALDRRNEFYALTLTGAYLRAQNLDEAQALINQLRNSQNQQVLMTLASMQGYISQVQSVRRANEGDRVSVDDDDAKPGNVEKISVAAAENGNSRTIVGTLVNANCNPDGSGVLYLQEDDHLVELRFKSFSEIAGSENGTITCTTKNKRVAAEFGVDGLVKSLSAAQ